MEEQEAHILPAAVPGHDQGGRQWPLFVFWGEECPAPHSYVKALNPSISERDYILGDRALKEVIKLKRGHLVWALIQ